MISMMGKDYIWVTDLVEMGKANSGLVSYDEVYQRLWDPFKKFTGPLAQYVAATSVLHKILQKAIEQERPLVRDLIIRRKSRKPYFEEAYKNNLNWLLKGVEGKGIDKRDLREVAKATQKAAVEGVSIDFLENRLHVLSRPFIEARYQSILSYLGRHVLPYRNNVLLPSVFVDFDAKSKCFDADGHEKVSGRFDVFLVGRKENKNIRHIMEIKVSDPWFYKQLFDRPLRRVPIGKRRYDLLQTALCDVMAHDMYKGLSEPKVTAELFFMRVGQKPQRKKLKPKIEKAKIIGSMLLEDMKELREVGPEEFRKRREKNGSRSA